jgi:general secretion pathway protein G
VERNKKSRRKGEMSKEKEKRYGKRGYTLVELMIVIAILTMLMVISVPLFNGLKAKARIGATKGNLGILRSALSAYYGQLEGSYPLSLNYLTDMFVEEIPFVRLDEHHGKTNLTRIYQPYEERKEITSIADTGEWGYWHNSSSLETGLPTKGGVFISCTHLDAKGREICYW